MMVVRVVVLQLVVVMFVLVAATAMVVETMFAVTVVTSIRAVIRVDEVVVCRCCVVVSSAFSFCHSQHRFSSQRSSHLATTIASPCISNINMANKT